MDLFTIDLILPERKLYKGPATKVFVPGEDGDLEVMARHMSIIAKLRPGKVIVSVHNEPELVFEIEGGYLEMVDDHCTILASGQVSLGVGP